MQHFNNQAAADKFTDQLLALLRDTYYTWTEEKGNGWGHVQKCTMLRGYRKLPAKAEEVFTGQSVSYAMQCMRDHGWRNIGDDHKFCELAEELGFTVRRFWGTTVITL